MSAYKAEFSVGSKIQIANADVLVDFQRTWKFHNKLTSEQLPYGGQVAEVEQVLFYHGGDVLYKLKAIPLLWHGQCVGPPDSLSEKK